MVPETRGAPGTSDAENPVFTILFSAPPFNCNEEKRDEIFIHNFDPAVVHSHCAWIRPTRVTDKRQHTGELYSDREKLRTLLFGALTAAKAEGGDTTNAVAMGYCFGGAAVLKFARAGADLKGFVTFHGGLQTPVEQDYAKTRGRLLILHGTADENVPMNIFAELATRLENNDIPHEMITYGGAPHAFTVFGSERYREDADRKSWQRFAEFLRETLF